MTYARRATLIVSLLVLVFPSPTFAARLAFEGEGDVTPHKTRTVAYPTGIGVQVGNGWNTFDESKAPGICISFKESQDSYQDVSSEIAEAIDEETLSALLNLSIKVGASGSIGGFSGGGSVSTDINTYYKFTSKDTVFVAKASAFYML